ncbi:MAG: hypothetical protein KKB20_11835 [Proteobacteria bacterium]|nr:hypothetical protein [Pseudomonadota bacterium]
MAKMAAILSLVLVMALGAGSAMAGSVPITNGPLFDHEWTAEYERGVALAPVIEFDNKGLDKGPLFDHEWETAYREATEGNARATFTSKALDDGPLTDAEWRAAYEGRMVNVG